MIERVLGAVRAFVIFAMETAAVVLALLALTSTALGQARGDISAAADAFTRAQQAELRGDYAEAAQLYALADQIAPAPEALRSAAVAAHRADMDATAATYAAELLDRDSVDPASRAVAEEILRDTEEGLARIVAECEPACRVLVDGRIATRTPSEEHVLYVRPGTRVLAATFEGGLRVEHPAQPLVAGQRFDVEFDAPEDEARAGDDGEGGRGGVTPWLFATGATLTAAAGAVTIWSGIDVMNAHDRYDRTAPDADAMYDEGQRRELRTNVLIGVTATLAAGTVVVGVLTDWDGDEERSTAAGDGHVRAAPVVVADRHGGFFGVSGTFH